LFSFFFVKLCFTNNDIEVWNRECLGSKSWLLVGVDQASQLSIDVTIDSRSTKNLSNCAVWKI
jgi:hypothetical protein